jgi:uncharacterized protein
VAELIFELDSKKQHKNLRKHRIGFDEAKTVFSDPLLLTYPDENHSETEERYISLACCPCRTLPKYDWLGDSNISCRKATSLEYEAYEEN